MTTRKDDKRTALPDSGRRKALSYIGELGRLPGSRAIYVVAGGHLSVAIETPIAHA